MRNKTPISTHPCYSAQHLGDAKILGFPSNAINWAFSDSKILGNARDSIKEARVGNSRDARSILDPYGLLAFLARHIESQPCEI